MTKRINLQCSSLAILVLLVAFSRVIPLMPNFSPLGAIGLFGAAHFSKKWQAFTIPILAIWLSDLFVNNVIYSTYFDEFTWLYDGFYWQYSSYLLIVLFGLIFFRKITIKRVLLGVCASTSIFFLVSNFGCWVGASFYPQNFSGLIMCYAAGVPFIKGTFIGDLAYSSVLFGGYYLLQRKFAFFKLRHLSYN